MSARKWPKLSGQSTREEVRDALDARRISALEAYSLMQQIERREQEERIAKLSRSFRT